MFGAFILLCGTTHVLEIYSIWHGAYRLTGVVKAITAVASVMTAVMLVPLVPRVVTLVGPGELRAANDALRDEIATRKQAERDLRDLNAALEDRVARRTAALASANAALRTVNASLEARVATRTAEIADANTALEARNRDLQDVANVASHDLQEPLRKILAFGDVLRADESDRLSDDGRHTLGRMQEAATRMSRLIRDLRAFSRVTTEAPAAAAVDLGAVVDGVLSDLEVRIGETGGRVDVGPLPTLEADATLMRQLFQNLIGNALKYHRAGVAPVVTVRAEAAPEGVRIVVADNGIGFDAAHAERIFAPFTRLHGRGAYEGTGIGLAIVRRIAERYGGAAVAEGTPGEGATFTVTLPLRPL